MRIIIFTIVLGISVWASATGASAATVVDASGAEALYSAGDFKGARAAFLEALDEFGAASKDSSDYRSYRELAYLYDRLADCCFTQRDFAALKLYLDGMLEVSQSELNLVEGQLSGALMSGIAQATARYLSDRVDDAVRLNSIARIKRSIGLILLDSGGEGRVGEEGIHQYQLLAQASAGVIETDEGLLQLNVGRLEQKLDKFEAVQLAVEELVDLEELWLKYPFTVTESDGDAAGQE